MCVCGLPLAAPKHKRFSYSTAKVFNSWSPKYVITFYRQSISVVHTILMLIFSRTCDTCCHPPVNFEPSASNVTLILAPSILEIRHWRIRQCVVISNVCLWLFIVLYSVVVWLVCLCPKGHHRCVHLALRAHCFIIFVLCVCVCVCRMRI